ncbi:28S ribosomal protein S28, mitochondrial-like [Mytilus californianus]|uniref:28S ribosomal protein S28, mitochondrial-like n=1 Tax=Mytilus californianus TaxID=6549 RepID=UPI00224502C8|nr:28S ribosomal protein S28, mitochondrial-like [Mytilus californianus]
MAASMLSTRNLCRFINFRNRTKLVSFMCSSTSSDDPPTTQQTDNQSEDNQHVHKVVQAFEKLDKIAHDVKVEDVPIKQEKRVNPNESFASLLRKSKLLQIGKPAGKVVTGKIIEVQDADLYIDFGGKFHCVCPKPAVKPELYHRGVKVKLVLKDLEMSSSFLGSEKHLTLLEADAVLLGLLDKQENSSLKK